MNILIILTIIRLIKSQFSILSPSQLLSKINSNNSIKSSIGNFGEVPFGKTLMGYIKILRQKDGTNYWCDYSLTEDLDKEEIKLSDEYLPIILVDHSLECKYAEKAYNVQRRGGSVMLLVSDSNNINEEYNIDDPIGNKVHIPSIIINKETGNIIKEFIREKPNENIIVSIKFSGVKKTGELNIEFYYRSDDIKALYFFEEFNTYKNKLSNILKFTPRLKYSKFVNDKTEDSLSPESKFPCIKKEHYCVSSNNNLLIDNPREILLENLRQSCIYETLGLDIYWKYIIAFSKKCANIDKPNFNGKCANEILTAFKINIEGIKFCMETLIKSNGKVEEDYDNYNRKRIFAIPELTINGIKYKGSWYGKNIFNAICNGFIDNEKICGKEASSNNIINRFFNWGILIIVTIMIFIILICTLLCYKNIINQSFEQTLNDRIQKQAMKVINQYQALKEGKENKNETKIEIVG